MNLLVIGLAIGALSGMIVGSAYDHWRVSRIVEHTILEYRIKEAEDRKERLQRFIDEQKGGAE